MAFKLIEDTKIVLEPETTDVEETESTEERETQEILVEQEPATMETSEVESPAAKEEK